ncbi:TonB-dependent receptor [Thalassotalea fonticola]|uniref:TonB-dependent receptor n=1 Tax=Thalassotalea fonticola TaxID=3065649 RepID=A0ABZ0GRY9_9GAMM|nr:TonB-dependent receptor [Colwelliaceae bacterium S1-1]
MKKNKFKLSALAIIIGINVGSVYAAQDDADVEVAKAATAAEKKAKRIKDNEETEVIVVTGFKDSLSKALSHKRHADIGMDVISAEDIGKLPDVEIGDVLERIAGVQVDRGDDGVVSGTSIRGLPGYFNRTLYNGRVISTSLSEERFFDSQVMPAAFMSRVEVHKTSSADVVEGGLAGVVNLKSIRAFDIGKRAIRFKATATKPSNSDDTNSDVLAVFSDLYLDDSLGFTIGVNNLQYDTETQKSLSADPKQKHTEEQQGADFNGDNDLNDTFYLPASVNYALDQNFRERSAAFVNLEWRPTPELKVFGEVFYSGYDEVKNRSQARIKTKTGKFASNLNNDFVESSVYESDNFSEDERIYLNAFHNTNAGLEVTNQLNERESDTAVAFVDVEYLYDAWTFNFGANLSKSKTTQFQVEGKSALATNSLDVKMYGADIDSVWQTEFVNYPNELEFKPLTVNGQRLDAEFESNSWGLDFDGEYEFDFDNDFIMPTFIQFGLHYTEDESLALKPSANFGNKLAGLPISPESIETRIVEPSRGDWFDGALDTPMEDFFWPVTDMEKIIQHNNWTSEMLRAAAIEADNVIYNPGIDDDLKEDITAAYVRLNFENAAGDFTGNLGLRYVHTDQFVTGRGTSGFIDEASGDPLLDPTYQSEISAVLDENLTSERSYDNYLPSLNLRYLPGDDWVIRTAWSSTMTRPLREDLKLLDKYNKGSNTLTSPDPELDAFVSENVDLSVEWYFDESSALTFAWFYKDIDTLTGQLTSVKSTPVYHLETEQVYNTDINYDEKINDTGAIIQGTTIGFEQPFSYLPSFLSNTGIKVNYTYIDNSRPDLLKNVSKDNAATTLYYDGTKFDARLSHVYRSERSRKLGIADTPDHYRRPSSTFNASVNYKPVRYVNIGLGISNITDEAIIDYNESGSIKNVSDSGRTISLSITARL